MSDKVDSSVARAYPFGIKEVLIAACFLATGGGVGTWTSSSATSAEIRAVRVEIMGKLDTISHKLDDHSRRISNIEDWTRSHERERGHPRMEAEVDEIKRRLELLESKSSTGLDGH